MKTIRILFFFDQKISSYILAYFQLEWNANHNTTCFFILLTNFCRKKVSPNSKAESSIGFLLQKCQNKGPVKIRHITLLAKRLETYLSDIGLIDSNQEGFSKGRNTVRYLHRLTAGIKGDITIRLTVLCLFIDFEKAFDSVWKKGLIVHQ